MIFDSNKYNINEDVDSHDAYNSMMNLIVLEHLIHASSS